MFPPKKPMSGRPMMNDNDADDMKQLDYKPKPNRFKAMMKKKKPAPMPMRPPMRGPSNLY